MIIFLGETHILTYIFLFCKHLKNVLVLLFFKKEDNLKQKLTWDSFLHTG